MLSGVVVGIIRPDEGIEAQRGEPDTYIKIYIKMVIDAEVASRCHGMP